MIDDLQIDLVIYLVMSRSKITWIKTSRRSPDRSQIDHQITTSPDQQIRYLPRRSSRLNHPRGG